MTEQTFICNAEVLGQRVRDGLAQSPHYLKSWFVRIDGDTPELVCPADLLPAQRLRGLGRWSAAAARLSPS
jgi:hypothetical protein